jgi:Immunoglobulin-like domain of bacterial spore germination
MNKRLKVLVIVLGAIILILLGVFVFVPSAKEPMAVPSAPAVSADGHLQVMAPLADDLIASPVAVSGTVTGGGWFFEATFPVTVEDASGTVLGRGQARARGDWTSSGTVPFAGSISFAAPEYATGTVVFEKDNPSGLPQYSGELRILVRFK